MGFFGLFWTEFLQMQEGVVDGCVKQTPRRLGFMSCERPKPSHVDVVTKPNVLERLCVPGMWTVWAAGAVSLATD